VLPRQAHGGEFANFIVDLAYKHTSAYKVTVVTVVTVVQAENSRSCLVSRSTRRIRRTRYNRYKAYKGCTLALDRRQVYASVGWNEEPLLRFQLYL
jgi:hypothetical protein